MEHVDVFACTYVADFEITNFTFHVYAGGTLSATTEDGMNENGRWDDRYARGVFHGRVVKKHGPADYDVEFTVVSRGHGSDDNEGIDCTAHLWVGGMTGDYLFVDSGKSLGFNFDYHALEKYHDERDDDELDYYEFDTLDYSEEELDMPCTPLTLDKYRFSGQTMTDSVKQYHDSCTIEMVLCADNTLHGQNVNNGQVSGTWTQDVVKFTSVANVSFEETPSLASLRGTW